MKKLSLALVLLLSSANAHALEVGVLGGFTFAKGSAAPTTGTEFASKPGFTFGAMLGLPFMPGLGLELDALLVKRTQETKSTAGTVLSEISVNSIMVPAIVRFTLLPIVSFGGGLYYANGLGKVSVTTGTTKTETDFASAALASGDFGAVGSVQARFSLAPLVHVLLDGRYLFGLKDTNKSATEDKTRDLQFLAGACFGF